MAKMPVPIAGGSRTYPIGGGGEAPTVDTAAATGPYQHGQTAGSQMRRGGTPAPTGPTPVMPSLTTGLQEAMDKGTYDPREGDEPAAQPAGEPAGEPARQPYSTLARAARKTFPDNTDKAMAMANEKGGQWQHWKKILDKNSREEARREVGQHMQARRSALDARTSLGHFEGSISDSRNKLIGMDEAIEALKSRQATMDPAEYEAELIKLEGEREDFSKTIEGIEGAKYLDQGVYDEELARKQGRIGETEGAFGVHEEARQAGFSDVNEYQEHMRTQGETEKARKHALDLATKPKQVEGAAMTEAEQIRADGQARVEKIKGEFARISQQATEAANKWTLFQTQKGNAEAAKISEAALQVKEKMDRAMRKYELMVQQGDATARIIGPLIDSHAAANKAIGDIELTPTQRGVAIENATNIGNAIVRYIDAHEKSQLTLDQMNEKPDESQTNDLNRTTTPPTTPPTASPTASPTTPPTTPPQDKQDQQDQQGHDYGSRQQRLKKAEDFIKDLRRQYKGTGKGSISSLSEENEKRYREILGPELYKDLMEERQRIGGSHMGAM